MMHKAYHRRLRCGRKGVLDRKLEADNVRKALDQCQKGGDMPDQAWFNRRARELKAAKSSGRL